MTEQPGLAMLEEIARIQQLAGDPPPQREIAVTQATLDYLKARATVPDDRPGWHGALPTSFYGFPLVVDDTLPPVPGFAIRVVKQCPQCGARLRYGVAWWWTGYGATCTEACARDLIRSHEGGVTP